MAKQIKQNKQPIKKELAIKTAQISAEMDRFVLHLSENGGNVTAALKSSGLNRATAYAKFRTDEDFARRWLEAQESATDELLGEAHRRAVKGLTRKKFDRGEPLIDPETGEQYTELEYSDTLLIYMLKQSEARSKWRKRLIQVGNLALEAVKEVGDKYGIAPETIEKMQAEMTERFTEISLI